MARIFKGMWDCSCGRKAIDGPIEICPGCGSVRGKDVQFYLPSHEPDVVTDERELLEAKAGPDKICAYCKGTFNSFLKECPNCSSGEIAGNLEVKEYHGREEAPPKRYLPTQEERRRRFVEPVPEPGSSFKSRKTSSLKIWLILVSIFLALAFAVYFLFFSVSTRDLEVVGLHWERNIAIEIKKPVTEHGWEDEVPSGATVLSRVRKLYKTREVPDGYEYVDDIEMVKVGTKEVPCGKINLGNGYFEEKTCPQDVMKPKKVKRKQAKTKEEKIYRTWYTYSVMKWVPHTDNRMSAWDQSPHWPRLSLASNQRESSRSSNYWVKFKDRSGKNFEKRYSESEWLRFKRGQSYKGNFNSVGMLLGITAN